VRLEKRGGFGRRSLCAGFLLFLFGSASGPATARDRVDVEALARSLESYVTGLQSNIIWDRTDVVDGEIQLRNFYLPTGDGGVFGFDVAYLREFYRNDDRWVVGQFRLPYRAIQVEDGTFSLDSIGLFGLRVPAAPPRSTPDAVPLDFDQLTLRSFALSLGYQRVLGLDDSHVTAEIAPDGDSVRYSGAIEAIHLHSEPIRNPQVKALLTGLGYPEPSGFLEFDASVEGGRSSPARVSVDKLDLTVLDAAALRISAELTAPASGGAPATDRHRADIRFKAEEAALRSLRLRFENETLVPRLLAWLGGGDGATTMAKYQVLGAFGALAGPFLSGEEAAQSATALSAFLDDPQVLEIELDTSNYQCSRLARG
jgi:hypothetical protein